ncbi:MAG TPA: hypothetical protein VF802_04060 [Candidatus Limnocylindrales bacterium]
MSAHVADGDGLAGGSSHGRRDGSLHIRGSNPAGEPAANLLGCVQLSPGERSGPRDERPGPVITWSFSLEQPENPLDAVGSPGGDHPTVGLAQRLGRSHRTIFYPEILRW